MFLSESIKTFDWNLNQFYLICDAFKSNLPELTFDLQITLLIV